jgi:hypothetical protein
MYVGLNNELTSRHTRNYFGQAFFRAHYFKTFVTNLLSTLEVKDHVLQAQITSGNNIASIVLSLSLEF